MKRTRKWAYVAQEARRLADLGLTAEAIGQRLELSRSTVWRWMKQGKLPNTGRSGVVESGMPAGLSGSSPREWAAAVRRTYGLDATDDQLVTLAEAALTTARDPGVPAPLRLSAMGRFQALVKQLALVARASEEAPQKPEPQVPARAARTMDPRIHLMAVK